MWSLALSNIFAHKQRNCIPGGVFSIQHCTLHNKGDWSPSLLLLVTLIDAFGRVIFTHLVSDTRVIWETRSPTWDQMLMFKELILWGDVNEIAVNPPTIVVEVFDKDIGVSGELNSIYLTALEISAQWKKTNEGMPRRTSLCFKLRAIALFQSFLLSVKLTFHSEKCFLVNSEHKSTEYFWAPKKLEWAYLHGSYPFSRDSELTKRETTRTFYRNTNSTLISNFLS